MSNSRGYLQIFTLVFFGLVIIGILSFFIYIAWNFITLPDRLDGNPPPNEQPITK